MEKLFKRENLITGILYRLAAAYLFVLVGNFINTTIKFTEFDFVKEQSLAVILLGTVIFTFVLLFVKSDRLICALILAEGMIYSFLAIQQDKTEYFTVICIAVLSIFIFYSELSAIPLKISKKVLWIVGILLLLFVTVGIAAHGIMRFNDNNSSTFDLGIFSQMFYYMKTKGLPWTTCERDKLLSHFAVHISPIFYLLLPVYKLIPDTRVLIAAHFLVTFSGVIPLILICRRRKISNLASLGFALCFLFYPGFAGGCGFFIHENNFLPPLLLWLIWFMEKEEELMEQREWNFRRWVPSFLMAILVFSVKEDAAIYVGVIAFYFAVAALRKRIPEKKAKDVLRASYVWMFGIAVLYFLGAVFWLNKMGDGVLSGRYSNYDFGGDGNLFAMVLGIIKNPIYLVNQCLNDKKVLFLMFVLLPLFFLPLFSKKIENWLLFLPMLAINIMTSYTYQHDINYQYVFGTGTLVVYLAVKNYSEMERTELRRKLLLCAVTASTLIFGYKFTDCYKFYWKIYPMDKEYRQVMQEAYQSIPSNASVVASTFLVPALSQRDEIYELETTKHVGDYYVIDLRGNDNDKDYNDNPLFESVFYDSRWVGVYRFNGTKGQLAAQKDAKAFSAKMDERKELLETKVSEELKSRTVEELGDLDVNGVRFRRVTGDQNWGAPTEDGSTDAVYLVDANGVLVYLSFRDGDHVATWSGPTTDEQLKAQENGWLDGNGAGWSGDYVSK